MQQHFIDEELAGHRAAIMQKLPFPLFLCRFRYIVLAQRDAKSLGMLRGLQTDDPPSAFEELLQALAIELDRCRYDHLLSQLDIAQLTLLL